MATVGAAGGRITAGAGLNLLGQHGADRNAEATVYVGNLDAQVEEEVLWELFLQAGPVTNVYVPKDRVTSSHQGYGFVEYRNEEDADYVRIERVCVLARSDATRTHDGDDKNIRASDEFRLVRLNDIMVEFLRLSHDDARVLIDDVAACVHGI